MNSDNAAEPVTIQLFPDYAGTALWLGDPIGYEVSGLSPALIQDLMDWEQSYYDSINLDNDHEWKSLGLASAYTQRGNELGQRVADEIGPDFEVEFSSYQQGVETRTFRAGGPASNADAALAFERIATARAERESQYKHLVEEAEAAGDTGWFAYAPLSDTSFEPEVAEAECLQEKHIPVSLFPDESGMTLWLTSEPLDYGLLGLSQCLVEDLKRWSRFYFESLNDAHAFKDAQTADQFTMTGSLLAQRLANELGFEHEVRFLSHDNSVPHREYRSESEATNPGAAAVLAELSQTVHLEVSRELRQAREAGIDVSLGWFSSDLNSTATKDFREPGEE